MAIRVPQFESDHFDIAEHVAQVRPGTTIRGIFIRDLVSRAEAAGVRTELFALAGVPRRPYLAFTEYPLTDWVRLLLAAGRVLHRDVTWAEGLRRMGHGAMPAFLTTRVGAMIFNAFAPDLERMLLQAPKVYRVITTAGQVSAERAGPRHVQLFYEGFPGMLDSHQVGVIEGVLRHYREPARVQVDLWSFGCGMLDVSW
ncbi:MAG: DUF2378 family protein [Polyangiales bacterium]